MTAPAVDLSLPPDDRLLAAATPNPRAEAERLTVTGKPDRVAGLGLGLRQAGAELDRLYDLSWQAQRVLAGAFANDGTPVYDETAHRQLLPAALADAGTRLHDVGRRVGVVSEELASAIAEVTGALKRLQTDLNRSRTAFAAEVDAARGRGGLIRVELVAQLQARCATVAAQMQELVDACGRGVVGRIARYEEVLGDCQRLLGELGPRRVVLDTTGTQLNPLLSGQYEGFTSPGPQGPTAEIHPVPPPLPREPGFVPAPVGPGPLITLPAPSLGAGLQDGPGSGQRNTEPKVKIDADPSPGNADTSPGGEVPSKPPAAKPLVENQKLKNILDNLYRGTDGLTRTGDGTTADAVIYERATGEQVGNKDHEIKARESVRALENWLKRNPDATAHERAVAEAERTRLVDALNS